MKNYDKPENQGQLKINIVCQQTISQIFIKYNLSELRKAESVGNEQAYSAYK